jgi:16S rRNA (uracil1498-N3)-methyltransferase
MIRLFVDDALALGARVVPRQDQARYLTTVMRLGLGAEVLLFNGRDGEWRAAISDIGKRGCSLLCVAQARPQGNGPDLELIVALVKRVRLETIVEKAAELGAAKVLLAHTRRSNDDRARLDRLNAIAVEAAEQTGRLDVPEIVEAAKLDKILDAFPADRRLLFCDEGGEAPDALAGLGAGLEGAAAGGWSILIGPEGGFAPEERSRLRGMANVTPVTLGPRILRADTAAIAAMTLWQASLGDWTGADPVASNRYSG